MIAIDMVRLSYRCIGKLPHMSTKRVKEELGRRKLESNSGNRVKYLSACCILICIHKLATHYKK